MHIQQTGHDLVVRVKGGPDRLALRQVLEDIFRVSTQIASCILLLALRKTGDHLIALLLENVVPGSGASQSDGRQKVSACEMAAQLAGGFLPAFIGRGAGGNASRDADGMQ